MNMLIDGKSISGLLGSIMPSKQNLHFDELKSTDRIYRVLTLIGFILLLCAIGTWSNQYLHHQLWPADTGQAYLFIGFLVLLYAICMMLPFMPAIELGLVLLAMLDVQGILMLYLVTVLSLSTSYALGRLVPIRVLKNMFAFLRFQKASDLLCASGECDEKQQIDRLLDHAPKKLIPFLLRHRYCVFGVVVNTPGNMILGGAGGIAMMSGISRLFNFKTFLLTLLIAVSPLPIFVILIKLWA